MITGIDLVVQQLRIAGNQRLRYKQRRIKFDGNAIEFRINAEDPRSFLPQAGKVSNLNVPGGNHVRFDTFLYSDYVITHDYDSLVGKLIVWGETRKDAIERSKVALNELTISGVITNTELHKAILESPDFKKRNIATDFLDRAKIKEIVEHYENMKLAALFVVHQKFAESQNLSVLIPKKQKTVFNTWKEHGKREQQRQF